MKDGHLRGRLGRQSVAILAAHSVRMRSPRPLAGPTLRYVCCALLTVVLGLVAAEAGTLYQSAPTPGGTVSLARFNPAMGRLTDVQLTLSGNFTYWQTFYNVGPATSYTLNFYTTLFLSVPGTAISAYDVESYTVTGTVGANTGGGCSGSRSITAPPYAHISLPADLAFFTGSDPVNISAVVLGAGAWSNDPNIQVASYPYTTLQGIVGLTYTYAVPEPSTLVLLVGGLVMLARRSCC
jgi:hypothetical protein